MLDLEKSLAAALDRHLVGVSTDDFRDYPSPPNLAEAIRYSLLAPGKRIRPRLVLACARMLDLSELTALPAALALEMVHCFTLIHDDLPCMDDDDFRRGRPSNHKVHGEALALLAGDALMVIALETLTEAFGQVSPEFFARALKRFCWACGPRGVMGGQAAEALLTTTSTLEELERMHAMKTGALFSAALLLPMDLAGVPPESPQGRALTHFAAQLGLAFQVADDLDDAIQDTQKDPTSILTHLSPEEARKQTLAKLNKASEQLERTWGNDAAQELLEVAREVARSLENTV